MKNKHILSAFLTLFMLFSCGNEIETNVPEIIEEEEQVYVWKPTLNEVVPTIKISTPSGTDWVTKYKLETKSSIEYVDATVSTENGAETSYNFSNASAKVKVRGNYTLNYDKKPIRIKFNSKTSMFGMNNGTKTKSWILYAEWKDISMLNNSTALYLGHNIMGADGLYNSDFMYTHVYINNEYWGLYTLVEYQEIKPTKFNITEPDEDDPENPNVGYLVEYDKHYNEEDVSHGGSYTFTQKFGDKKLKQENGENAKLGNKGYTIKSDCYSKKQCDTVANYFENAYMIAYYAMHENKFYKMSDDYSTLIPITETDPVKVVDAYIDIDSWVDMFIISEICKDPDIDDSSLYMDCDLNKTRFKPLTFEGLWDFDSALGIKEQYESCEGFYSLSHDKRGTLNPWFGVINGCTWFMDLVKNKWEEIASRHVFENTLDFINACETKYSRDYSLNFSRWPKRLANGMSEIIPLLGKGATHEDAVDYLSTWLKTRITELNKLIVGSN